MISIDCDTNFSKYFWPDNQIVYGGYPNAINNDWPFQRK